ncbi:MAG TPA: SulP family inorganic anion transporter [Pyrinomonadaceae bacterium]|nr:SulP family inorganic anion transporter [Pyrinomonadaceae bacterium]
MATQLAASPDNPPRLLSRIAKFAPAFAWLRSYDPAWLAADLIAGLTLAAYMLPAGIGDASLAGLPAQAGIYACLFSGLIFWVFCSSRHTAITSTSAISLLVGSSLGAIAGGDTSRFAALATCTALLVAAIAFVAWLVRAGAIVNFISETVMIGFKAGVGLHLASTQLPKLFGFSGGEGSFWRRSAHFFSHISETNSASLAIGGAALAILILGKIFLKNKPVGLFVVIGGVIAASLLGLNARGVKLLGEVPQGLPPLGLPAVQLADINRLLPLAVACFMLGAVETAAIGRMFAAKHRNKFEPNQEFLGLAAANLATGLGHAFPVSGGMSQSLVNESGGARSPLSGLASAIIILLVSLFLSSTLRDLPQPVLAAIVLVAVAGLFNVSELKHLWHADRAEFVIALAAIVGVLSSGLLRGVMIGALISLVQLLRRASHPHVATLGRIPGTDRFSDQERHPDNESVPGVIIFRVESGLFYFNVEFVRETILARTHSAAPPKLVVLDLSASAHVDLQAATALVTLADELAANSIQLEIVETRSGVRDRLRAAGLDEKVGRINRFRTVAQVVENFEHSQTASTGAD